MLLVANGSVFTRNAQTPFIPNGAVAIDGDTIVEVGPECELKAKYPDAEYVDAQGNLIMPGLINCHTHIYSGLARGLAIKGCNPTNFLENLEQQWWKIDDNLTLDGTKASAYATILDSIRDGVTTIFDHHASFCEIPGSLFTIKDAAQELGMRSCLCYEVSDRRGQEKCDQAIAENAEFAQWAAKERRDNDNHMIAAMFGGHATFTLSDETMDKMAEANNGLTGFHIHVCEGMNDVWDSRLNRGGHQPRRAPAAAQPAGSRHHAGPLHPRDACRDGYRQGVRHLARQQPRIQYGQRRGLRPRARVLPPRHPRVHGHRCLHPRYAREPQGLPDHSASQRRYAQRGAGARQ